MSDEWSAYTKDPRMPCKYGSKCYQQNPNHSLTFKHPPEVKKNTGNRAGKRFSPYSRNVRDVESEKKTEKQEIVSTPINNETKVSEESPDRTIDIVLPEDITYYETSEPALLKELFLVEMPADFFKFYEILNVDGAIVKTLASVNLELIGPYDLLLGKLPKVENKELYLVHWRFFYDPPEFQAVLKKKGKSEYHIGYFRDAPNEMPAFVGSNDSAKNCQISILADNIFGAVYQYLQKEKQTSPFTSMACQKLMDKIKKCAGENDFSIDPFNLKKRKAIQVTSSFHHAGIVVPYDKKTKLGYRKLVESDENIKKILNGLKDAVSQERKDNILSNLQPVITYASIALDESDFGTGLELGIDLFCSGFKELESCALSMLNSAYSLLNRQEFHKIIQAHVKYRRRGPHMSICP